MKIVRLLATALERSGFWQKRCIYCLTPFTPAASGSFLCPDCQPGLLPYAGPACALCGQPPGTVPLVKTQNGVICSRCLAAPPPWSAHSYFGLYSGILRDLLLRLKFSGEAHLSRFFGEILLQAAQRLPKADAIVPIPQYPAHLRKRGFNQAHEIARELARISDVPLQAKSLSRIKPGVPQEHLNAAQRQLNLAGAFKANPGVAGLHVWLVDDILTTGATCVQACNALLAAGCKSASLLFVARTPL